jgi:hypothetical protein
VREAALRAPCPCGCGEHDAAAPLGRVGAALVPAPPALAPRGTLALSRGAPPLAARACASPVDHVPLRV